MVRYKNRYTNLQMLMWCEYANVCRYFLIQFHFENDKDAHEALGGLDVKSLREILKVAMKTLHGDYGLGCIQHSLNCKLRYCDEGLV